MPYRIKSIKKGKNVFGVLCRCEISLLYFYDSCSLVEGPSFFLHGTWWLTICSHIHIYSTPYVCTCILCGNSCLPWHLLPLACDWVKNRPIISLSRSENISDYWGSTFLIWHARWANCSWQFNEFTDQLVGFVCYNDELWNSSNQLVTFMSQIFNLPSSGLAANLQSWSDPQSNFIECGSDLNCFHTTSMLQQWDLTYLLHQGAV